MEIHLYHFQNRRQFAFRKVNLLKIDNISPIKTKAISLMAFCSINKEEI